MTPVATEQVRYELFFLKTSVFFQSFVFAPKYYIKTYQGWEDSADHDQLQFSWPRLGEDMLEVEELENH